MYDPDILVFDKELDSNETKDMDLVLSSDVPKQKKKKTKNKKPRNNNGYKGRNFKGSKPYRSKSNFYRKNKTSTKSKSIFSEDFDVIVDGNVSTQENENESKDDQRFNTEKHHKQQHKF